MFFMEVVSVSVKLMLGFLITQIGPLQLKLWSISFLGLPQLKLLFVCVHILGLIRNEFSATMGPNLGLFSRPV